MRAVKLPANMAVSKVLNERHYVVVAVNSCVSYQRFLCQSPPPPSTSSHSTAEFGSSAPKLNFSIDNLVAEDMTQLLVLCRAITHPEESINFSFQGAPITSPYVAPDLSTQSADEARTPRDRVRNLLCMHVVGRVKGDFVPNNEIYDRLKWYQADVVGPSKIDGFTALLRQTQHQTAQSAAEACEALGLPPSSLATATPEAKLAQDPLWHHPEARKQSVENATISIASPSAGGLFTFYPFSISVEASIPYRSRHFCVLVNLKPILPHHLMVVPLRCVGTIHGLTHEEVEDWGQTMVLTLRVLNAVHRRKDQRKAPLQGSERASYCVAIQQGSESGQTVPHLHTHIIPYSSPEDLGVAPDSDENQSLRIPRTKQEMGEETSFLKPFFTEMAKPIVH